MVSKYQSGDRSERLRIRCSPEMVCQVEKLVSERKNELSEEQHKLLQSCIESKDCTVEELKVIVALRKKMDDCSTLCTAGVAWPEEPKPPVNPELEKRRAWLIARQQQREYHASIKNLKTQSNAFGEQKSSETMSDVRRTMKDLSVGVAMILVCVGVFMAVKFACDSAGMEPAKGMIGGLLAGSAILFVEMILFVIRQTREETYERMMKKQREKNLNNISNIVTNPTQKNQAFSRPQLKKTN